MLKQTAMKLSKLFHCSPQKVLQYYERIITHLCKTNPEFSKYLQANYDLGKEEIENLGGEFISTKLEKKEKVTNRTLDRFL